MAKESSVPVSQILLHNLPTWQSTAGNPGQADINDKADEGYSGEWSTQGDGDN